jgi:predicted phage terminase large subunit-like protein
MNHSQMIRDLDNAARQDLAAFIHRTFLTVAGGQAYHHNWHIEAIAWALMDCWRGNTKRLVITLPPRHLKSICASVAFPAWVLGQDPTQHIVCASYSENLASKHALDCRAMMESDFYRRIFPQTRLSPKKNAELDFMTTQRGSRYSTSVGGTFTGRGGNTIIIDDPLKPDEAFSEAKRAAVNEWYDRTLVSRLDDKRTGVIILIMQRLHLEDLVGHVWSKGGNWRFLQLPAIAQEEEYIFIDDGRTHYRAPGDLLHPKRESQEVLNQLKRDLGSFNFSAQYLQCPLPLEGEIINWSWFPRYDELPEPDPNDSVVQSWDTASKPGDSNDYSVCTTWLVKGKHYYLKDVLRLKLNYPDLKKIVIRHALHHRADTLLIEDQDSGTALIQELQNAYSGGPPPIGFKPQGDKQTRMCAQSAKIEAGRVLLPRTAPWLDDFRAELLQFPHGRYDDQVDSMSQALIWLGERDQGSFSYCFA